MDHRFSDEMKILVLNSGSSSQKSALFELGPESGDDPLPPLWEGKLEWGGAKESLSVRNSQGKEIREYRELQQKERSAPLEEMLRCLWSGPTTVLANSDEIDVIGHRVVHGGPKLHQPVLIDALVKRAIEDVSEIAPLHNQTNLAGIYAAEKLFSGKPQVAVFDTGFHRTLPDYAAVYPGPYEWFERGIRRYGFHGINHQYCAERAARMLARELSSLKVVSCHLGNGCSLAAIDGGKSIDTTMGFTPLEGLMMGTRSGSVDPGILTYLMRTNHDDAEKLDRILNHQSGLLGISGISSDMRDVLKAARSGNVRARLGFEIFMHRLRKGISAMAGSLGGVDVIIFTAGIGENSAEVRSAACSKLGFLGVRVDEQKNSATHPDTDISATESRVKVLVIRAQEDWSIARECSRLLAATGADSR
jgi:acetate kinase